MKIRLLFVLAIGLAACAPPAGDASPSAEPATSATPMPAETLEPSASATAAPTPDDYEY